MTTTAAGVDVGGTFTDAVSITEAGRVIATKVLSTPADQSEGVVAALQAMPSDAAQISRLVHGTTVVTNLLLERSGARVVLCATEGASDLLELRRQERVSLYDLAAHHPEPLVPAERVIAVAERVGVAEPPRPLTESEIARVVVEVRTRDPAVVVIALLHSYADPTSEQRLAAALQDALPGVDIVTSAAVLPEIREYERTTTAVAEGYARPSVRNYLAGLTARLEQAGLPAPAVMSSSGGMRPAEEAAAHAASLALSGPAGGVVGAAAILAALGLRNALTIDIGGTSADAGLILDGVPLVESGGAIAGVPIALPRVLVETVSAGGGSVAYRDDGGVLRVGPRSAGVRPGPVCFGRGGLEPTVTDAQVTLGRIAAGHWSGGVQLDDAAARAAVAALGSTLGADAERTAAAIIRAADAEMARALRRVSVDRGVDPRELVLVAFGGGGPLHACALAESLGITEIIVPPFAGVLSALGLALAPVRRESACSVLATTDRLDVDTMSRLAQELAHQRSGTRREWVARTRYVGQGYELEVPWLAGEDGAAVAARFAAMHQARYGFTLEREIEIVVLRHVATDPGAVAQFRRDPSRLAWDPVRRVDAGGPAVAEVEGPTTVLLPDATLWVAEGWRASALPIGGWRLRRQEGIA